jgi:hypothetical protein
MDALVGRDTAATRTEQGGPANLDGAYQLILGRDRSGAELAALYEGLADMIVSGQSADGSWPPQGQLPRQRRPAIETQVASTMTALLALRSIGRNGSALERGLASLDAWKASTDPIESTEALLLRMLVEYELGTRDAFSVQLAALLARQQSDGGWSWRAGEPSDAFATGQVLAALGMIGERNDVPIQRAWLFLRATQRADGSWLVPSTKVTVMGPQPESIQWGTGWAAIGILSTLSPRS